MVFLKFYFFNYFRVYYSEQEKKENMKKTLVALGDSITVGTYTAPADKSADSISSPNYVELVKEALGYTELINYAQNGTCISPLKGPFPLDALLFKFDKAVVGDAIIISAGTNDYAAEIPLGTLK